MWRPISFEIELQINRYSVWYHWKWRKRTYVHANEWCLDMKDLQECIGADNQILLVWRGRVSLGAGRGYEYHLCTFQQWFWKNWWSGNGSIIKDTYLPPVALVGTTHEVSHHIALGSRTICIIWQATIHHFGLIDDILAFEMTGMAVHLHPGHLVASCCTGKYCPREQSPHSFGVQGLFG